MSWASPNYRWLAALALPLLTAFFWRAWRVKQNMAARFIPERLRPVLADGVSPARQKFRMVLVAAAVVLVLLALSGPRWGYTLEEATQKGLDIVVVFDTSRSMLAADATPNRLEKAKLAVLDLMRLDREDRLGLVPFAGAAFLQCPLTLDDQAFRQSVEALNTKIVSQGGTAIATALRTALKSFGTNNSNHKVIVLLTDGDDHDDEKDTLGAAKEAADAGVNIFTIGVGTPAGELLQVTDEHGAKSFIKDEDGNVVKSHLNEPLLREIASSTGGFYLPLIGADPMSVLYDKGLAPLPKSESATKLTRLPKERYHWPLSLAVVCLLVEFLLPDRAPSRRPERPVAAARPAAQAAAAAALCLLLPALHAAASPSGAYDKFQDGDYQGSFDEYNRLAGQTTNDYRLHYDAGTAAYRAKQLEAAEKQLDAALASPDIISDVPAQEHTYYNLGNTLYRLGEPAADPQEKQKRWEQSIANYTKALQIDTNDLEARNNLEFVKKRLEEYQRQQQQQQNNQQQNQNQDQQKQNQKSQGQNQQNQDQKNQQQQAQQNQPQSGGQDQGQQQKGQQAQQKPQDGQQGQPQQAQGQQNQPTNSAQAAAAKQGQTNNPPDQDQQAAAAEAQMSMQQAQQMLDAEKDDEQSLIFSAQNNPDKSQEGKIKDW